MNIVATLPTSRSPDVNRLLRSTLSTTLLGEIITMDVLARIGFRFLAVPACLDGASLTRRLQRFRNTWKVDSRAALQNTVHTISDGHLDPETKFQDVAKLENPRHRFLAELFWPHLSESEFAAIPAAGDLKSDNIVTQVSGGGNSDLDRVLHEHTLAIASLCQAIEAELDFLEARSGPPGGKWEKALQSWYKVWSSEQFWSYLQTRVRTLDDPRLQDQDVKHICTELPAIILGFLELLAGRYAAEADYANCARHLGLIRSSGFPAEYIQPAIARAAGKIAGARLEDLQRRTTQTIADIKEKCGRKAFDALFAPLLQEARDIHQLLSRQLGLPDELLEKSAFDQFASIVQKAVNKHIEYSGDDRERSLLYSSCISRELLKLPLSAGERQTIEQSIREDNRILYGSHGLAGAALPQALKCFFVEGAEADPDSSIVVTMYRVTDREVVVDRSEGSAGVRVKYRNSRVLIPRSKLAQQHSSGGSVAVEAQESEYTPKQRETAAALKDLQWEQWQKQQARRAAGDAQARAAERKTRTELDAASERASAELTAARNALEAENKIEQSELDAENKRHDAERAKVQRAHEAAIRAEQEKATKCKVPFEGAKGEVLVGACIGGLVFATLLLLGAQPFVALICAAGAGGLTRKVSRDSVVSAIDRIICRAVRVRDREWENVDDASGQRKKDIMQAAERRRAPFSARLAAFEAEIARIKEAGQRNVAAIKAATDEEYRSAERTFEESVKPWRAELTRKVTAKRESQKSEFPAYQAAKEKGFREGKEPSNQEMQMTDSERMQAMLRLRLNL